MSSPAEVLDTLDYEQPYFSTRSVPQVGKKIASKRLTLARRPMGERRMKTDVHQ